jgi:hypothetical protein
MLTTHTAARWSSELEIAKRAMSIFNDSTQKSRPEESSLSSENSGEIKLRLLEYSYRGTHMTDTLKSVLDDSPSELLQDCSPNSSYDQHLS